MKTRSRLKLFKHNDKKQFPSKKDKKPVLVLREMSETSIITMGGDAGAGKSTVARMLAFRTGFTRMSTGDLFREWAKDASLNPKKLPFREFYANASAELDLKADEEIKRTAQAKDRLILEGRMTFNLVPHGKPCLKVYLSVEPEIGAKRIFEQKKQDAKIRKEEEPYGNVEEATKDLDKRRQSEIEKYSKLYGLTNPYDPKYYDLIIDTSYQTPEEVVEQILNAIGHESSGAVYADL